jgi:hypothetical protein
VEQGGEPRPISPGEADFLAVQLPFENRDLMAQSENLDVFARSLAGSSRSSASVLATPR